MQKVEMIKSEEQNGKAETVPSIKAEKRKSSLLPDNTQITKLNIDDSLLDQLYQQAYREATAIYNDAQLSQFTIQVFPFREDGGRVYIYLHFYSKWADKLCKFQFSELLQKLKHYPPDKHPVTDSDRNVFTTLPWKTSPQLMQIPSRVYDKIKPLPSAEGTGYYLSAYPNRQTYWRVTFEDGLSGKEYWFEWDGRGLDENSIKQLR